MTTLYRILSVLTLSALMSTPVLRAQDDQSYDAQTDQQYDQNQNYDQNEAPSADRPLETPQYDPPSRVASLRYMDGSVSIQPQGTGDWVAGEVNRPVTNADNIWADRNSRAELSVGSGVVRIGSESSLTITDISQDAVQLQLHQGALNLHVRRLFDNERYEVDTPNQAFTVLKPGDYRFDVDSDGDKTVVTVWSGEGESTGDGPAVRIRANEQVRFSNGTSMTVDVHTAPGPDSFDEWAFNRDQRRNNSESSRYVSPDVVGSDDLDEYGTWRSTPEYGEVWSPRVDAGWAPYSYGHWIWEDPWGWTWVDYEPWGFAPFHYGRWVYDDGFWGWAPGPVYARPYYAPALVAWFGGDFGGGFGLSVGFGGLGWCPLGFGEPFIPWYGVSSGYFNQVNITNTHITNITNITNIYNNNFSHGHLNVHNGYQMNYANMRAPGGFTAVSRHTLVNSLSVQRNRIRVSPNQLTRLSPIHSPSVAPTRATMIGSRGVRAAVPPQRAFARPVISRPAVSAGNRGSFNAGTRAGSGAVNRGSLNPGARGANATNTSRPGQAGVAQRPTFGGAQQRPAIGATNRERFNNSAGINNRAPAFNNARTPQNGSNGSRPVPRPPAATGNLGSRGLEPGTINSRPMNPQSSSGSRSLNSGPQMTARNNVPRPPMGGASQPSFSRGASPNFSRPSTPQSSAAPRSNDRNGPRSAVSVPRPSGAVAPRGYSSAADRGNYSSPRPSPSYQPNNRPGYAGGSFNRPSYSRPAPPSRDNGRGSYGRSAPLPSYGGSRSMPSYGGGRGPAYGNSGRSMPMPSYSGGGRAASPSFGGDRAPSYGGGGRSMPSYGGGGGGRSGGFGGGGGGHMPSGGGGQAPSVGGGHSGGGSHSGGGRH